jgi:putative transposase
MATYVTDRRSGLLRQPAVPGTWCSQSETTVRAVPVVVNNELGKDGYETPASEDEDSVQALTANRADEAFCMPCHPQTCGEVERESQTMKTYLANQEPATTKKQPQGQPDRFIAYDNTEHPHRSLHRCR